MTTNNTIKIIYISGSPRSGSTILGKYLGQYNQFFHIGEMRYIWERNFNKNYICECGEIVNKCKFWKRVILNVFNKNDINIEKLISFTEWAGSNKRVINFIFQKNKINLKYPSSEGNVIRSIYEATYDISNSDFIVDGSKYPMYGAMLSLLPKVEVCMIHLVRDPRAVSYSRMRRKILDPVNKLEMQRKNVFQSTMTWMKNNIICEFVKSRFISNHLIVRYEDFSDNTEVCFNHIIEWLRNTSNSKLILSGTRSQQHSTSGNPVRFDKKEIVINEDLEWKDRLPMKYKLFVTLISLPLLIYYKYPLKS